jgi:hypothetical protein
MSQGTPPAHHDERVLTLNSALLEYKRSQKRDANSIEKIAVFFDENDQQAALSLLGLER